MQDVEGRERKDGPNCQEGDEAQPPRSLPPLAVCGLVVSKEDLVAALRVYVPSLVDVASLDGERFLLSLTQSGEQKVGGEDG